MRTWILAMLLMLPMMAWGEGTWEVLAPAGTASGQVWEPRCATMDSEGNLYVGDEGNARVQIRNPQGNWRTLKPPTYNDIDRLRYVSALAFLPPSSLYVAQSVRSINQVREYRMDGNLSGFWLPFLPSGSGLREVDDPLDLSVGPDKTLYIADCGNERVQYLTQKGVWGTMPTPGWRPLQVEVGPEGTIYLGLARQSEGGAIESRLIVWHRKEPWEDLAPEGPFSIVRGLACDSKGNLYVAHGESADQVRIHRRSPSGEWRLIAESGHDLGQVWGWVGLYWAPTKRLIVCDFGNNRLLSYDPQGVSVASGDLNGDGRASVADTLRVLRYVLGLEVLPPADRDAADLNRNGRLDVGDIVISLRMAAGIG